MNYRGMKELALLSFIMLGAAYPAESKAGFAEKALEHLMCAQLQSQIPALQQQKATLDAQVSTSHLQLAAEKQKTESDVQRLEAEIQRMTDAAAHQEREIMHLRQIRQQLAQIEELRRALTRRFE